MRGSEAGSTGGGVEEKRSGGKAEQKKSWITSSSEM